MRRRFAVIAAAVVLAAGGSFVVLAYVNTAEDRALAGERTVEVFVVAKPVPRGTPASEMADRVRAERVPAKVRARDAVADLETLGDRVAVVDLVPGEQVIAGRFADPDDLEQVGAVTVPDGFHQVTVALTGERTVGGLLEPGHTVGVVGSFEAAQGAGEGEGPTPAATHFLIHKAQVTRVQVTEEAATSEGDEDHAPKGNVLVTLALSTPDVEKLVYAAEFGSIWLTYEPPDAPEGGTRVVTRAEVFKP